MSRFMQRGEIESALTDYAKVTELQPSNMEAISRQAMHKFKKGYVERNSL